MSDPEVPQPEQPKDVNDVLSSANEGLADAEAAGADVSGSTHSDDTSAVDYDAVDPDPDVAAFAEAERSHPGTFVTPGLAESAEGVEPSQPADSFEKPAESSEKPAEPSEIFDEPAATERTAAEPKTELFAERQSRDDAAVADAAPETSIADTAYDRPAADDTQTRVVSSEPVGSGSAYQPDAAYAPDPVIAAAAPVQHQPIFVQAPEAPRDRGNRGTAAGIGLLATLVFAILYLAIGLGWTALQGDINGENFVEQILAPLTTWGFWTPVVVFFLSFWLLGAVINRGRWGRWVIFGLLVGVASYAGYILGQLFEAPFWTISSSEATDLIGEQLFAPLAIAAFVLGRELTIWFGAWVARSGARKTELNVEAQREYERTLEAGPTLSR